MPGLPRRVSWPLRRLRLDAVANVQRLDKRLHDQRDGSLTLHRSWAPALNPFEAAKLLAVLDGPLDRPAAVVPLDDPLFTDPRVGAEEVVVSFSLSRIAHNDHLDRLIATDVVPEERAHTVPFSCRSRPVRCGGGSPRVPAMIGWPGPASRGARMRRVRNCTCTEPSQSVMVPIWRYFWRYFS